MNKISKVLKGAALAVAAVVAISGSAFAADYSGCVGTAAGAKYPGLSLESADDYKVKCPMVGGTQFYGKTTADCAQASTIVSNPEGCTGDDMNDIISKIINAIIFVIGIVAVIMIVLGGISYATSQGDPSKVKKGKDTILYGIIGLVVALLAFAIVNFVL
ncbi:MAG: pilin, partial [Candidatus Saccharibacteria bacterium]|nr:pilin [Candidatus Saccharibacteria bacterium]